MKILVTIGRGGTGKSSFTALMTKAFIEAGQSPLLLVDADPDQNLAEMLGVTSKKQENRQSPNCWSAHLLNKAAQLSALLQLNESKAAFGKKVSTKAKASISWLSEPNG